MAALPEQPRLLPFKITQDGHGMPVVLLGGIDITRFVASEGLHIEYVNGGAGSIPSVTLRFAPGRLAFDFDVNLLQHLLADARAEVDS